MLIFDSLLISGIRWTLDKVAGAVDAEMNNEDVFREELLAAQMKFELGEIDEEELRETEAMVLKALREIQMRKRGETGPREAFGGGGAKIESVEVSFGGDEGEIESTVTHHESEPVPGVVVESGSGVVEEPEEAQLLIESAGVEAPVTGKKKQKRRERKRPRVEITGKSKKKTKRRG
jgi:hypothetical protein